MLTSAASLPPSRIPQLTLLARILLAITACGVLAACPPKGGTQPAEAPPMCGHGLARQVISLGVDTTTDLQILDVTWEFKVYCTDRSGDHFYTHDTFLNVVQGPRADFLQIPADGFEGLGLGRLLTHAEERSLVSITLANAQEGNWCIEGTARFVGESPKHFGPFTVRQEAGSSSSSLAFVATRVPEGISVRPTMGYMDGCVRGR